MEHFGSSSRFSLSSMSQEALFRRAKALESRLEAKVQKYSSIAQKINADFLCDEENPLIESKEEQELAVDIDHDLTDLAECIAAMRSMSPSSSGSHQEVLIKRYHEIHFDYSNEFKKTSATVHRKRESMELFQSSKKMHNDEQDSSTAKLLRERSGIVASMKSLQEVMSQAFETKTALVGQRNTLSGASSGLTGLVANVPSFNRLIDGIQKKKTRESMIVALVIAFLTCFCIWWVFLR